MRRTAVAIAAAMVAVSGLSVTPAFAHEGWQGDDHEWRGNEWREHEWRERALRRHEWWEHHRWQRGYYNYGWYPEYYNYGYYYAPPTYYTAPGVTFGSTFR